jgi:nucleoid DNA-binding protein
MTKKELIDAIANDTGLTREQAQKAVNATIKTVSDQLASGRDVSIAGFGKFSVVKRGARQGINPRTGERVRIKASKAPKFSAGLPLKRRLSGLPGEPDE